MSEKNIRFRCPEGPGGDGPGHSVPEGRRRHSDKVVSAAKAYAEGDPASDYKCLEHNEKFIGYF